MSATFLPFRSATEFELAVLRHQDRFALRRRRLIGDILDRRARGLREDRRRFAGVAEIDGADIERLEQRRPGRKFRPYHLIAGGLQLAFERALALEQHQLAVFLEADANDLVLAVGGADRQADDAERQHGARDQAFDETLHDEILCVEWNGCSGIQRLGMAPDDVANHDRLRDQAELEEAIGDGLLGLDDLLGHRTDRERRAVGRDGLDFERNAGHRGERISPPRRGSLPPTGPLPPGPR